MLSLQCLFSRMCWVFNGLLLFYMHSSKLSLAVDIKWTRSWYYFTIFVERDINEFIIRCKCFFFFIGREPTTWPANNCLQIMVCSWAMSFNCFWLQILFCSCVNETTLFPFLRSLLRENGGSLRFPKVFLKKQTRWSNDKTIVELGYRKISWFVSVSQKLLNLIQ